MAVLNVVDGVSVPETSWYAILPLAIVAAVVLGAVFLIVLGILIGRRAAITMKTGGAIALTFASMLLLSGLWCMLLSPTTTSFETKESFYRHVSISGFGSWSYSFSVQQGDSLSGSVDGYRPLPVDDGGSVINGSQPITPEPVAPDYMMKSLNVTIYDPDGNILWSETNVPYSYFDVKAPKPGSVRLEVKNADRFSVEINIQATISSKTIYRVLEPLGQWLSLVSLPIFGLGAWAAGLFSASRRGGKKESRDVTVTPDS
jgi:hypothetical protein